MENSIILDDNLTAWDADFRENLILSKKYFGFFTNNYFDEMQIKFLENFTKSIIYRFFYLSINNKHFEILESRQNFIDENNCPYSVEHNFSNTHQINELIDPIKNIYKLSILKECKKY